MFKEVAGFRIQGCLFQSPKNFPVFYSCDKGKNEKIAIIYGKNGSGKSTCAHAIYEYSTGIKNLFDIDFFNISKTLVDRATLKTNRIFVFNETFINKKVKFKQDNKLNAIFLPSDDVILDKEIEALESKNEKLQKNIIRQHKEKKESQEKNCQLVYKDLEQAVREGWSKRVLEIQPKRVIGGRIEQNTIPGLFKEKKSQKR